MEKKEIPVTDGDLNEETQHEETPVVESTEEQPVAEETEVLEEEEKEVEAAEEEGSTEDDMKNASTEQLAAELSEMKDKYLRLYAEFDNYRKRTMREKEMFVKTASENTISALLPAVDDFARAIKAADAEDNDETVSDGVRLVYNKLMKALEQRGLKVMESTGETFNPDLHEALTKIPAPTEEMKGKVIDTVERGYYLNDKIIRYAKVIVGQ
jgi:molecular chaperone GrpE